MGVPIVAWFDGERWIWQEEPSWGDAYETARRLRLEGLGGVQILTKGPEKKGDSNNIRQTSV